MHSNTGRHLDKIAAAVDAGDLVEAATRDENLRAWLLMLGIRTALQTEPLTAEQRRRLRDMSLAVMDSFVGEHLRRGV